jgi:hypothetical protein
VVLESLADRRKKISALLVVEVLCDRIEFHDNSYSNRRRNVRLVTLFHQTSYGMFERMNNVIYNFSRYCDLVSFSQRG